MGRFRGSYSSLKLVVDGAGRVSNSNEETHMWGGGERERGRELIGLCVHVRGRHRMASGSKYNQNIMKLILV